MEIIGQARRRAELLIPKLEALTHTIGGGLLHEAKTHFTIVRNYNLLLDMPGRISQEHIAADLLHACDDAETFMAHLPFDKKK